jgi:alpha-tubulin suppressor-like RCC1 family protein
MLLVAGTAGPAAAAPVAGAAAVAGQALAPPSPFGWGAEFAGELGNGVSGALPGLGQTEEADSPVPVSLPGSVAQLSLGGFNGAALLARGTVATWGYNFSGELGDGTLTSRPRPAVVPGLTGITQVADSGAHMLARDASGRVWAWGDDQKGEQGNGRRSP